MIAWWLWVACAGATPVEPAPVEPVEPAVVATPSDAAAPMGLARDASAVAPAAFVVDPGPPIPVGDPTSGALIVAPAADGQVRVTWSRPGSNGCYRQGPVTAEVEGAVVRFRYTTSRDGDVCTMALVPGGFSGLLRPPAASYVVVVVVDGVERGRKVIAP